MNIKCDRCRKKYDTPLPVLVDIESANDDYLDVEICDDCWQSLRLWLYGEYSG